MSLKRMSESNLCCGTACKRYHLTRVSDQASLLKQTFLALPAKSRIDVTEVFAKIKTVGRNANARRVIASCFLSP